MKTITVPADISVRPPSFMPDAKPETISFRGHAFAIWLDDPRAIEGSFAKQLRWAKVVAKFEAANPGDAIELEDADYAVLRGIVDSPKVSYKPVVAVQLLSFSQAVLDAV